MIFWLRIPKGRGISRKNSRTVLAILISQSDRRRNTPSSEPNRNKMMARLTLKVAYS